MNAEQLIKLIDAGFTKEDILNLAHSASPSTTPQTEPEQIQPAAPEAPAEEPKNENQDISNIIKEKVDEALKPFADLYSNMAKLANMPSMDDVQPKGIEDIITNFFKGE